jgi:hypothetical protein
MTRTDIGPGPVAALRGAIAGEHALRHSGTVPLSRLEDASFLQIPHHHEAFILARRSGHLKFVVS